MSGPPKFKFKGLEEAFQSILGTFTCEDGGLTFMCFLQTLRGLDEKACEGEVKAAEIISIVLRFNRLIELSVKRD